MNENNVTNWSDEQLAIFEWFSGGQGALVVQARAGTGKTTTIKEAFSAAPEASMLYAVFNKKNQIEAAAKIVDPRVDVKTLHSVGYAFIRSNWPNCKPDGFVERDRVTDGDTSLPKEVVTAAVKLVGFAKNLFIAPTLADLIDLAETRGVDVPKELQEAGYNTEKLAELAFRGLENSKKEDKQGRISFDDMVWLPVAKGWVRPRYDLVVVDEAQDMNLPQLTIARNAVTKNGRICVVGDDRQAIYGFRGAVQDGMKMMIETLNAKVLPLSVTYRCPKKVVALAAQYVTNYKAAPSAPEGRVTACSTLELSNKVQARDAVLSRINAPLMPLCLSFLRAGIPARIEGRDIGQALLKIVKNFKVNSIPKFLERLSGWEERRCERLAAAGREAQIPGIQDQAETLRAVCEGATGLREVEERLDNLFRDTRDGERPCVVLSTIHKAKGLEWDRVFCLEDTFRKNADGGEEENIRYVAYTRAKVELTLVTGR